MKNIKGRAIRVIKRLTIKPAEKAGAVVEPVVEPVIVKGENSTASAVGDWIRERQENRTTEVLFSNDKIQGWKNS